MTESRKHLAGPGARDGVLLALTHGLWSLAESRRRTLAVVTGLAPAVIDWVPAAGANSIGTLLYHLAVTEMEWIGLDIEERTEFPPEVLPSVRRGAREPDGRLVAVLGESLATHLERLATTRAYTLTVLQAMSLAEFRRPRVRERYTVTPEWVVHHLASHEAEHRGQIVLLRVLAEQALSRQAAG